MNSAVVINLDYENHRETTCRQFWETLEARLCQAGFSKRKSLFLTKQDWRTACETAKAVVAGVENEFLASDIDALDIVREFYCFEYVPASDLLDPLNNQPEVSFADTSVFATYFAGHAQ